LLGDEEWDYSKAGMAAAMKEEEEEQFVSSDNIPGEEPRDYTINYLGLYSWEHKHLVAVKEEELPATPLDLDNDEALRLGITSSLEALVEWQGLIV
jgi:hypothetical protein